MKNKEFLPFAGLRHKSISIFPNVIKVTLKEPEIFMQLLSGERGRDGEAT